MGAAPLYDLVGPPTQPWPASVDAKKGQRGVAAGPGRVLGLSSSSALVTVSKEADRAATIKRTLERAFQN
ncbi:hypothetical protein GCM10022399_43860 [Terrabacter ginsenosidimutans]|uniref:Uncharacterized protein n=1 Tax=Terrabacter ginsenosidimutans TaxID=490575 RepID=A0ABP7ERP2_9MICO